MNTATIATPAATATQATVLESVTINGIKFEGTHPLVIALDAARSQGSTEVLRAVEALDKAASEAILSVAMMQQAAAKMVANETVSSAAPAAAPAPQPAAAQATPAAAPAAPAAPAATPAPAAEDKKTFPWMKAAAWTGGAVVAGGAAYLAFHTISKRNQEKAATQAALANALPADMAALQVGYTEIPVSTN